MTAETSESFYTQLFVTDPLWSTRHPNVEEAERAAGILPLLSRIAEGRSAQTPLRILDLGCGRGWLTNLAAAYGTCLGVDPVRPVVEFAKRQFPDLQFRTATAADLVADGLTGQFDVIVLSEVIEHVPVLERDGFVKDVHALLDVGGFAVVSTDRGEFYDRWVRSGGHPQPVENWLTEKELSELFSRHGFSPLRRGRVYNGQHTLSLLHGFVANGRVRRVFRSARQQWLLEGLQYAAAECQVWLFQR
jgi:SAM-dependent methyltransferase